MNINNTSIVEVSRNSCAFSGALQVVESIEKRCTHCAFNCRLYNSTVFGSK